MEKIEKNIKKDELETIVKIAVRSNRSVFERLAKI